MKEVLLALNQQPIAVYPIYIDITGSMTAGILLSQVMYWDSKMKGNEFYKNDAEFMQETRLTQSEFKTAKKIVGDLPFITIQRKGVPCRTWYSVNHTNLLVVLQQFSSSFTYQLGSRLSTSQRGVNLRTIIALFALILALTNFLLIYGLHKLHTAHERRIKAMEARNPEPEKRVQTPVPPKQIFEKPIVKNAKEVKPLEIGDGRMRFDAEAQVAEWI